MNLTWTKTKRLKLAKAIKYQSGCSCVFIQLTPKVGIKLYTEKQERDFAFRLQRKAYKLGFGPRIGKRVSITKKHFSNISISGYNEYLIEHKMFGYLTEVANIKKMPEKIFQQLEEKMKKHGFSVEDIEAWHNVGFCGQKPVCIDFDSGSMCIGS